MRNSKANGSKGRSKPRATNRKRKGSLKRYVWVTIPMRFRSKHYFTFPETEHGETIFLFVGLVPKEIRHLLQAGTRLKCTVAKSHRPRGLRVVEEVHMLRC